MHVLQFRVEGAQVLPAAIVHVRPLRLLDVGVWKERRNQRSGLPRLGIILASPLTELTELYERVWPGGRVDLVSVLAVELLREVLQEGVGQLLVEGAITEGQEADVLLQDVAVRGGEVKL